MNAYQIGIIEGRWENFLPPIRGGIFRANSIPQQSEFVDDDDSESDRSSGPESLMSDQPDLLSGLKKRHGLHSVSRGSSPPSSVSSDNDIENVINGKLSHIDSLTKKQLELDVAKYPALDLTTQAHIVQRYRELNDGIRGEGLYECNYAAYGIEICRYTILFSLSMLFLSWGWYGTSGAFLGAFWHQLVFTAHDAGHMGITHRFHVDTVIGIIIADFLGGLSLGWWKRSHNVHHIITNSPEHDPDIEHLPFFAISERFFENLHSTYYDRVMEYDAFAKIMVRFQKYSYYPIMALGRFNLYVLSWEYLIRGLGPKKGPAWWHRWLEIAGQVFFWTWFGYGILYKSIPSARGRFVFIIVSHMTTGPLHLQITLSHFAMSTADIGLNESFPQRMLRTTMDVDCPEWLDFFHGGLQFQAIHHLYPRIPRHNLRRTQKLVQDFCQEVGIPYALYGFIDGNKDVIGRLGEISRQAAILAECQKAVSGTSEHSHH